jgi:alpha-glucuronidase
MLPKICILAGIVAGSLSAETGAAAWLRYETLSDSALRQYRAAVPPAVTTYGNSPVLESARHELIRGIRGMLGRTLRVESQLPAEGSVVLGTLAQIRQSAPQLHLDAQLGAEGYWLTTVHVGGATHMVIAGADERGTLYGVFAYLRKLGAGEPVTALNDRQTPYSPVRWVNQWDNLDGTIERGYGGRSIFWDNLHVREDLSRVTEYGRLLASLGINGCTVTSVNANPRALGDDFVPQIARIADTFRPWGVRVSIAVDFGSPKSLGGLDTFDPQDARVATWWKARADALYAAIPDLGGFVLKADSEGRVGPSTYGRTHADAANVVARALKPHGGLLFYRGFVYDHHMDWRNPKNDRGRAAYDNFQPLDGSFDDNVIVQIKHGPIDFQVREPASPLFGVLEKTNQAIELQVTQEYFGQGRHTVFLVPMWKEALDFNMQVGQSQAGPAGKSVPPPTPVKARVAGKVFHRPTGGFVGVVNVGLDENWFGNNLSEANLYGFGRLAWNPDLSARQIVDEWTRLTFGDDPKVLQTVDALQLSSWRTYENYTGPLGLQTLTDIVGNHYGVSVEASERNGWGQWHDADAKGAGKDRTVATGTGYIGQYSPDVARVYESVETCPDDLLLFLHHVPYTHKLHSGKTVIQYIYDSHYEGPDSVTGYVRSWKALKGSIDERRYLEVLAQLEYQAGQAQVWRDAVTTWFLGASGIADAKGRVGHYPGRFEAESMNLEGYTARIVAPLEAGSGGKAIGCEAASCTATMRYQGPAGWHTLQVQYFDQLDGVSHFRLWVANQLVDEWAAAVPLLPKREGTLAFRRMDGSSSTRHAVAGISLRAGDEIRIEGVPAGGETAGLDYIEILPEGK